jgi:signal transduction histidine kinase
LDYKLPGLSGLEVLERLSSCSPETLTVMITAYATLETAVLATKQGAFDFLAKPFTPDELRATIHKASRHIALQQQAKRHAEEKKRIRFQFVSVLAHELKAPLAAVEGYLLAMQARSLGVDLQSYDLMIDRSITRLLAMRQLINDLLDLTRMESGQRKRELVSLDLFEIAKNSLELVRSQANREQVSLEIHADSVFMNADRVEIELIFSNLLTNAVKYNRPGGKVVVRITPTKSYISIQVEDTGIGMNQEETKRLFQDFVRIKNEKTRMIPGTGLGLSTVSKVVSLYNGKVELNSKPDQGTIIEVLFPL